MKILQVIAAYKPAYIYGGPTMSVAELSEQLVAAGMYTEVFATTANGQQELPFASGKPIDVDGVKVTYFKRLTKDHTHFSPALFLRLWKEARQFNVVHIHTWWNLVSIFSCLIALLRKVPVVISPRGTLSSYSFDTKHSSGKNLFQRLIGTPLLNRCHFHVTSTLEYKRVLATQKPVSMTQIANFVRFPELISTTYHQRSVLKLLFLSRVDQKKGLDLLIKALSSLMFPYRLTIAGSGDANYISSLKALAEEHQVSAHIDWVGFQHEHKFGLIAQHDLLVLPSYDENFGNVVIESLSQGTAVLVSSGVGLADYVLKNDFGWQCEPAPQSIAETLNQISHNQAQLAAIRINAPVGIRRDFNEHYLVQQYIDMYKQIIA